MRPGLARARAATSAAAEVALSPTRRFTSCPCLGGVVIAKGPAVGRPYGMAMRETGEVLLAYLDESYNKERYYIASLIVPQEQAAPLNAALDKVVEDAAWSYSSIPVQGELHGKELFQGQGVWRSLKPRQRIGIYNDAFQAIADHDVEIIIRGVYCERLKERYIYPEKPHKVVLGHLLERVDERAAAKDELAW